MTYEEAVQRMAHSAGVVKLICGVANNAAWLSMLDGYDHARQCRTYRHHVKRAFKAAVESFHAYERQLLYNRENRMFHLADMTPAIRKKYGDITDREYYDFWAATGSVAYQKTKPLLSSLWNKYRKSLEKEYVSDAEHVAWVLVADASLGLACGMFERCLRDCEHDEKLPRALLDRVFGQFSLLPTARLWRKALLAMSPDAEAKKPSGGDGHNIELGLVQLRDAWMDPTLLYTSTMDTVEEYSEVFRTKGEQKKSLREIADAKNLIEKEL